MADSRYSSARKAGRSTTSRNGLRTVIGTQGAVASNQYFAATNPVNNSTSKQMYSFSKSPRKSIEVGMRKIYCDKYYDLPSSVSMSMVDHKKTPGFGIGPKASAHRISREFKDRPPPGHYNVRSSFDMNKDSGKGF